MTMKSHGLHKTHRCRVTCRLEQAGKRLGVERLGQARYSPVRCAWVNP